MLSEAIDAGEIGIEQDRFKVPRYRPEPVDPDVDRTRDAIFAAVGEVQLPDILVAADARARFSWLALGRQPANERELLSLYAGLLALGTEKTAAAMRSEEHTSELQSTNAHLVCRLLLEKKKTE